MKIVLLGPPGAGKGTQALRISRDYGIAHISTGDIFRSNIREMTELGRLAKSYIDKGELVPDEVTISMVKDRLTADDCRDGFLLDGFPRTLGQAEAFDAMTRIDIALNIDVEEALLVKRIAGRRVCSCGASYHIDNLGGSNICPKCGKELLQRDDDKEETVMNRLLVYKNQTAPLIAHYTEQGVLVSVDGSLGIDEVYAKIREILDGRK